MIRLGIIGCAEIAYRRFMPAALKSPGIQVVCVSSQHNQYRLEEFSGKYSLEPMKSHSELIERSDLDAVYIPQPPALHYKWAKAALEAGKHVFLEKPSTTSAADSNSLVELADSKGLALHENYMFIYHSQIEEIKDIVRSGRIGDVRLIRTDFGFPLREKNDFRYVRDLGGGALLDAGGYPVRLATLLLGPGAKVETASATYLPDYEVDMAGSAVLSDNNGTVCQLGYGMDMAYRCDLEIWGSKANLRTSRIFTAPEGFTPIVEIKDNNGLERIELSEDDSFGKSIAGFLEEIADPQKRKEMYANISRQAALVDEIRERSGIV